MNITAICAWYEVGMRHYSFTVLKALKDNLPDNYNLSIILVLRNNKGAYPELLELQGVDIECIVIKNNAINILSKIFPFFFDYYLYRKLRKRKVDLMYILFGGLYFKYLKRIQEKYKVLSTVHDIVPHEKNIRSFKDKWLSKTENRRGQDLINNSNYLLTNSVEQYNYLKEKGQNKIYYVSMPTLINSVIANGTQGLRELDGLKEYILFFGRIDKYKGLDILMKTHIESKIEIPLVIAGSGNFWFNIPTNSNIRLINRYILDEELSQLFKNAKICVLPYISITQTSLISIPFYFKTPVILSDIPSFRFIGEKAKSLICDFEDPQDYFQKIQSLLINEELRTEAINGQNNYYQSFFDEKKFTINIIEVFSKIEKDEN
jgi:glycosyltransferase involved in cell wall biosynthesis